MEMTGDQDCVHLRKRLPPRHPKRNLSEVKFGKPIEMVSGVELTGWKLINTKKITG